jgi:NADH-quinone oxidoreductase subunit J
MLEAIDAINWHTFFFLLFSLVACGFALAMTFSSNIVRMAFYLIVSLGSVAGLFFLAGAMFVGAMQLMIYVGGTLVLLIFGVMLTAQERFIRMKTGGGEWVLAAIVGGSLLAVLMATAFKVESWHQPPEGLQAELIMADAQDTAQIGSGLTGPRVDKLEQPNKILRDGMSSYVFAFEFVSVYLLVVLIGAAYLARTKRRASAAGPDA